MKTKDHLTRLGVEKIKEIKKGMNKGRQAKKKDVCFFTPLGHKKIGFFFKR